MRFSRFTVLFFLLILSCSSEQERSVHLQFLYEPGTSYIYDMSDDVKEEFTTWQGDTLHVQNLQKQTITIDALKLQKNGVYEIATHMQVVSDTTIYPENFPESNKWHQSNVGHKSTYRLKMCSEGRIYEVEGESEKATRFYEEAYKTNHPIFPGKDIGIGYKWNKNVYIDYDDETPVRVTTKFKLIGFETVNNYDCAVIWFHSALKRQMDFTDGSYNRRGYQKWIYNLETISKGKIYFATELGVLIRNERTMKFKSHSDIIDNNGEVRREYSEKIDNEIINLVNIKHLKDKK